LKILVVGSGGREHAIAWKVAQSPRCTELFVAPGNAGTPGTRVALEPTDIDGLVAFCTSGNIGLVIVGPDAALEAGLVDALTAAGIPAFGPTRAAAEIEWSKSWSRAFCERHGIIGPRAASFTVAADAAAWATGLGGPVVVKADGLAAGKGVILPDGDIETAEAIGSLLATHGRIVVEERLVGEEISLFGISDGTTVVALPAAQDHKRIGEGDQGPNTGGMGAYAPAPVCTPEMHSQLTADVLQRAVDGMAAEGRPFVGVLFAGLMLTAAGPRTLEFNARLGDPESQVLLPLLDADLVDIALACCEGRLAGVPVAVHAGYAVTVVLASPGYPASAQTGGVISGLAFAHDPSAAATPTEVATRSAWPTPSGQAVSTEPPTNLASTPAAAARPPAPYASASLKLPTTLVFHAGTEHHGDDIVTSGGRVLAVTGIGATVSEARDAAFARAAEIEFNGKQFRRDIGWRALARTSGGYAASGVDIDAGHEAVNLMKAAVQRTYTPAVVAGVGSFGGVMDLAMMKRYEHPLLVASNDGVGTKVMVGVAAGHVAGLGADLVNHCINDILVQNARPIAFLDYVAAAKLEPVKIASVVTGMAEACEAVGCVLLGGETAEMPGVYHDGHLDVAGTIIGLADRNALLPRTDINPGDVLIGLGSSGPHTNGYSLLRRVLAGIPLDVTPHGWSVNLGEALLAVHRNYLPVLENLLDNHFGLVKALVHITGGGLLDNPPRILPPGTAARVQLGSWPVPPLFQMVRDASGLDADELHRTLNMGVGMVIVCAPSDAAAVRAAIAEDSWIIGEIIEGDRTVTLY
jgi:phosphoribosylamine--glycine ligase/phosphoribosylaminoimidazole synthetase